MKGIKLIFCLTSFLHLTLSENGGKADTVVVFDHNNGDGDSASINVQSCTPLPRGWDFRISSIQLAQSTCVELHASRLCSDISPLVISNALGQAPLIIDLSGENHYFNDKTLAIKKCSVSRRSSGQAHAYEDEDDSDSFTVSLYEFVEKKGRQSTVRIRDCATVPPPLYKNSASVDPRDNCVKLYAGPLCTGESVQIQPTDLVGSSNLHYWNFLDKASSIGVCARYQLLALMLHNRIRSKHNSPPLVLNETLNQEAQSAAEMLANQAKDPRESANHKLSGILIYTTQAVSSGSMLIQSSISSWYADRATKFSGFMQLVRESTKELGIGYAASPRRAVVVAMYSPRHLAAK